MCDICGVRYHAFYDSDVSVNPNLIRSPMYLILTTKANKAFLTYRARRLIPGPTLNQLHISLQRFSPDRAHCGLLQRTGQSERYMALITTEARTAPWRNDESPIWISASMCWIINCPSTVSLDTKLSRKLER